MEWKSFDHNNGFTIALVDGELIDFRPVKRDDGQIIQDGMYALSKKSRYFRFFSPITKLTETQLHYFTEVDQQNHVAWIALAHDQSQHPGVGIVRFIRFQNQPHIAEFAVTVIDKYQRRGLGTMLMAVLYLMAHRQGIRILRGFVLPENTVAMHWFERFGAVSKFENEICQMDIPVYSDLAYTPTPPLLRFFAERMNNVTPRRDRHAN